METPYTQSFFHSCLCFMANTMTVLSMVLIGLRFQHVTPHYEMPNDKAMFEITEAEIERREEEEEN